MSSGDGGSGKGFFDSLKPESLSGKGNFFENLLTDTINYTSQYFSAGLVGYGQDGVKTGVTGTAGVNGLKEITGAKAAEDANKMAREQFEQARDDAQAERAEAIRQTGREELQKSRIAGAARNARTSSGKGSYGSFSLGEDERDFLGL